MSGSEKKLNENTYDISFIKRVTKKFLETSSRARQRQRNEPKKVCCTCKVVILLIGPIVVFHRSWALPSISPLNVTRFYILFEQTLNIIESFAFNPG